MPFTVDFPVSIWNGAVKKQLVDPVRHPCQNLAADGPGTQWIANFSKSLAVPLRVDLKPFENRTGKKKIVSVFPTGTKWNIPIPDRFGVAEVGWGS